MPEAEQGLNMARNIGAFAGCLILFQRLRLIATVLPVSVIAYGAERIMLGL